MHRQLQVIHGRRTDARVARRTAAAAARLVAAVAASLAALLPGTAVPAGAGAIVGCRDEVVDVRGASHTVSNCSDASTARIGELLARTDAAYLGLIRPGDRFMANNQWAVWIDTQDAPGILRGLWPIDATGSFLGVVEPGIAPDAAKDVLLVGKGYGSIDAPFGYKGLHVEVWKTAGPDSGVADECAPVHCFYSVPNGPQGPGAPASLEVRRGYSIATYRTPLVNNLLPRTERCWTCGTSTFVGVNGARTELLWEVGYVMTPETFTVRASLTAGSDVNLTGAAGGLMLILNPACPAVPRRAYPGDDHFAHCHADQVAERSFHRVSGPSIGAGATVSPNIPVEGNVADTWAAEHRSLHPDEDRMIYQLDDPSPLTFSYGEESFRMTVTPATYVTDPATQDPYVTGFATHFNATPKALGFDRRRDLSGVSGIASVDTFVQPATGDRCPVPVCSLAVGPNRGALVWTMGLSHGGAG
ncbi:MAG TPA: hypothetical protein VHF24_09375 [Acidimicrobiales bacterium]|nr:hypothetical protein [Acidimicrobiales bacterium]